MTKEQETIENIKIYIHDWINESVDEDGYERYAIEEYDKEFINDIETILSMLKENSAEIEQKNTELAEKNAEIERLNRQIDLMAEQLAGLTIWDTEKEEPLILTDKEEIEDIKADLKILHQVLWDEHREGTYTIQKILEYIKELEQKESILDKVTDNLEEVGNKYIKEYKDVEKLDLIQQNTTVLQELSCVIDDIEDILEIIEGEKK